MTRDFLLSFRALDTEAEIFWDLPDKATNEYSYQILSDGREVGVSHKTHFSLKALLPETEYEVEVVMLSPSGEAESLGKLSLKTSAVKRKIDVTKAPYNAVGDGKTMNTAALQRALDDCDEKSYVYIPAGTFLTGALNMHSDSELFVDEGALLQGSSDPSDYLPKILSRFEGYERECFRSLLNLGELDHDAGYNCRNVIIRGSGSIMGGGWPLAQAIARLEAERLKDYIASLGDKIKEYEKPETISHRARGRLINMSNCQNIWIHGLTLGFGASWNLHFIYSDLVVTDHCTIKSQGVWNGDGWDPDSSTNSTIYACDFYTEDDSVAIKSGKNPEGNVINRPTRGIRVFDCICHFGHGLCIGSEMSGGVEDVRLWDCDMGPTWSGIEIKATRKRGGYVRGISVRDIRASHVMIHSVGYNDDGEGFKTPPVIEDCHFERMHLLGRFLDNNAGKNEWHDCPSILLCGFDEPGYELKNISFKDIETEDPAEGMDSIHIQHSKGLSFENIYTCPRTNSETSPS